MSLCSPAWGQEPPGERRSMTAIRLDEGERILLDGVLDEEVWQRAQPATDFLQRDPDNGSPATERTEVRIVYDRQRLYMGVICFDSEPDKLLGFQLRRDEGLGSDDNFQWSLDPFFNGRDGYSFETNPSGLLGDGLITAGGGQNREWDGIWNVRVQRSDIGWTIEAEIPFQTLNFDPNAPAWGINFQRTVRRKNESSLWMGHPRNQGLRRMTNAGRLEGIREVSQGRGIDIKPYVTGSAFSAPGRGQPDMVYTGDMGLDLSYSPTPQLRASLTINTDFAQTEVDQRQVNLGRFSISFPERREFFLEGSGFFDFRSTSGGGPRLRPFFSRQIGLSPEGEPQPINFGARLAGQMGHQDIGILQVRTGEDTTVDSDGNLVQVPSEDFTILRIKRRLLSQSFIGGMFTRRAPGAGGQARNTYGFDMLLDTRNFQGSQNLRFDGFVIAADNETGITGGNLAYGANLSYPNDPWDASFDFREVQPNFDPAVGDVQRTDYRRYAPSISWSPRPRDNRWIRSFSFGSDVTYLTDRENTVLNRDLSFTLLNVQLHSQDSLNLSVTREYERLRAGESNRISGIPLVGTEFNFTRYSARISTSSSRMISVSPSVTFGTFYSGHRDQFNLNMDFRIRQGLLVSTSTQYNRIRLAEGRVQTKVFRITGEWQMSPWISLINNVQYDTVSRVMGWQARFRWIMRPGNDFYFVYTHDWTNDLETGYETRARRVSTKLVYTHRF
jgi:hypothetical protein